MNAKRIMRTLLSLVLVFCMVSGFLMVPVHAEGKTTFNYVSLGASNTNGYGMRGYITEEELALLLSGQVSKDDVNVYGYERKPEGAYPDLIRDYYENSGYDVNINQLAISSMRVEELRILLDDSYMGDDYSSWRFTGSDGWFLSAEPGGIKALRAAYKDRIKNADLITVDIGWNNFGVYVCNQLVDYMSNGRYKWTTELADIFDTQAEIAAAEEAKKVIGAYIKQNVGEGDMADALTDIFAYSILGYIHNFDIVMEKIYELNSEADVVVLGIQNLLHGVVVELNGTTIPLGDLFGNFVNMANYYASSCSPFQSQYQYVKAGGNDEHVTIFLDYMTNYQNGTAKDLDQNVKDCFDYYDDSLGIQTRVDYIAAEMVKQVVATEIGEDKLDFVLGFLECDNWNEVVALGKAGKLPSIMGKDFQAMFNSKYWPALYAAYDTLAVLVKEIANYASVDANGLLSGTLDIKAVENTLKNALEAEVQNNAITAANGEGYTVDLETLLPDAGTKIVAAMYIRYYMGNSFFSHPNDVGHAEIKNAVIGVLNNPAGEMDQALSDYLKESVQAIHELLCGAAGHGNLSAGEPTWAEDYSSCSVIFACADCGAGGETITDSTITSETTKAATCDAAGEIVYTADFSESDKVEPVTKTVTVDALGHKEVTVEGHDATCTEDGLTDGVKCERCGTVLTEQETIPAGHNWVKGEETAEGVTYTCTKCGETRTGLPGDANDDGNVTLVDAQTIMKNIVDGKVDGMNLVVCDMYQDGKIDLRDVQAILQYSVGLITELPFVPAA